jgi:hypothetical protein
MAERFAGRALGAERGTVKSLGLDKIKAAGAQALDEGVLSPLASTDDLIERTAALKNKGGEMMGKAYGAIDDAGASTFDPLQVASSVDDELGGFWRTPLNKGETNQFENTLETIMARGEGPIPLREAQVLKGELGRAANWKNKLIVTPKEQMARDAYGIVNRSIDDAVANGAKAVDGAGLSETLAQGKKLYGNASTAETLLQNKLAREEGNKLLGITDWGVLGAGAGAAMSTGGMSIPATMALTAGKKGLEKYGSQNAALGLNKVSKLLMKSPKLAAIAEKNPNIISNLAQRLESQMPSMRAAESEQKPYDQQALIQKTQGTKYSQVLNTAAQRGPKAFGAAHFVLQSTDPEYRKAVEDQEP